MEHPAAGPDAPVQPFEPDPEGMIEVAPAVVAVVVTHNPGAWFEDTLTSFGEQTYPNLSVLIVDAASDTDPTARVARILPSAYVKRLEHNPGFGPAANEVLEVVEGAAFYCLCHDDVALSPPSIRLLVEEAFRSNAGIVGPKLVEWDDPQILRQVGFGVDKFGVPSPYAEPGELDQEQHDAVRDVFAVPGACGLVRADLFAALGGFDPEIDLYGEDVDLCWRAHVAGARVMVVPAARVRHRGALATRHDVRDRYRRTTQHRLRTLLCCFSAATLLRVVPQALALSLAEIIWGVLSRTTGRARAELGAWSANLRDLAALRRRRKAIAATRLVPDRELRRLQVRGSARLGAALRGQADERLRELGRARRGVPSETLPGQRSGAAVAVGIVILVLVLGSRQLLFGSVPAIGDFARMPTGPLRLMQLWWNGWRDIGLGSAGGSPTGLAALAGAGFVFFGAMGQLRKVLILGLVPLGAWGAWLLAKPLGGRRSRIAALLVYAAIPVPYNALARGDWPGLVLYAAAPWLLLALARAIGVAPFGTRDLPPDQAGSSSDRDRSVARLIVSVGLTLALAALLVPFVILVAGVVAVGLVVGSVVTLRTRGFGRLVLVTVGSVVLAALLHLPWTIGMVSSGAQWAPFAGVRAGVTDWLSIGHLLRFQTGPFGAAPLGWAFLAAAALPLVIGRGWRFEWAVRAWFVALACWAAVWVGQQGWLPVTLPPADVLLAPAAAALALSSALGMAAFDVDLPGYRFGWRQALSVLAAAAVLVGAVPMLGGAFGGRWKTPRQGFPASLEFLADQWQDASFRVMWLGQPATLPVSSWQLDDHLSYATSNQGLPVVRELWAPLDPGASHLLGEAVELAMSGRTTHLGHLLAQMNVRYIVVPRQDVPDPFATVAHPPPAALDAALSEQVDLSPQTSLGSGLTVYANTAWAALPRLYSKPLPAGLGDGAAFTDGSNAELATGDHVLERHSGALDLVGSLRHGGRVYVPSSSDPGWHLQVDGRDLPRASAFGWANQFTAANGGIARLTYSPPWWRRGLLVLQAVLWVLALGLWWRLRGTRRGAELLPEPEP